ncbi:hypothetical protein [Pseudoduganella umbonata]|uniref:Uncharacterized protein n=1 Tax=Pseudoduganella umbonata TaxID=864828 RepID=A0A4V1EE73_9BURK|nr:hypothetical protein [Pseudoduganella umbonata]MBB3223545.1 hypothetical protein [Pseudoduganella umbonata]QCP13581.1 hypothetical protein FCL38_26430 [Pseudoduganella umbonata]
MYLLDSLAFRLRAPAFTQPPGGREPKVKKAGKENEAVHENDPVVEFTITTSFALWQGLV